MQSSESLEEINKDPTIFLLIFGSTAPLGQGLHIHEVSRSHTTTYHIR